MTVAEAWAAGLFEGNGAGYSYNNKDGYFSAYIRVYNVDISLLVKFRLTMGAGVIRLHPTTRSTQQCFRYSTKVENRQRVALKLLKYVVTKNKRVQLAEVAETHISRKLQISSKEELAWLAGIFEASGWAGVSGRYNSPRLTFGSTNLPLLNHIQKISRRIGCEGGIYESKSVEKAGYKRFWMYQVGAQRSMKAFAKAVLPLVCSEDKKRQLNLILNRVK